MDINRSSDSAPVSSAASGSTWSSSSTASLVVRRLDVTAEWRGLDWTGRRRLHRPVARHARLCGRCPVAGECLAAAIATDDLADWRGGLEPSPTGNTCGPAWNAPTATSATSS